MRALYARYGIAGREPPKARRRSARAGAADDGAARRAPGRARAPSSGSCTPTARIEPVEVALGITDHTYTEVDARRRGDAQAGRRASSPSSVDVEVARRRALSGARPATPPCERDAVIRVEDVHKYYDLGETRVHALRGVSVAIEPGGFVAIMGASGSGKSTFMNILGCLDRPSSGRYLLEGIDVSDLDKRALAAIRNRKIGFVFQGFNLLAAHDGAREHASCRRSTRRSTRPSAGGAPRRRSRWSGSPTAPGHFPSQMSGGQQQRVAIARALVNRPSILLADEPTGNLDSRTSVEIMEIFQDLNDEGLTIVLVTHEPDIAQFAKRVIVFRDGRIRKDEPVANRPAARGRAEDPADAGGLSGIRGARAGTNERPRNRVPVPRYARISTIPMPKIRIVWPKARRRRLSAQARGEDPSVTVVVVPRERFSLTQRSLEDLYEHTTLPFRLIYVDGGAPSDIRRYLVEASNRRHFQLIRADRFLSPNEARNLAQREVKTKYVVFLDNDVLFTPRWLEKLVQCAEETGAWVVGPLYLEGELDRQTIHMAGGFAHVTEEGGRRVFHDEHRLADASLGELGLSLHRKPCDYVEFHCALIRNEVFERLGPLDEALLSIHEHIDLGLLVQRAGGTVYIEPRAVVSYVPPPAYDSRDFPYFMMRWSDAWNRATVRHFKEKWDYSILRFYGDSASLDGEDTVLRWARGHRRLMTGLRISKEGKAAEISSRRGPADGRPVPFRRPGEFRSPAADDERSIDEAIDLDPHGVLDRLTRMLARCDADELQSDDPSPACRDAPGSPVASG